MIAFAPLIVLVFPAVHTPKRFLLSMAGHPEGLLLSTKQSGKHEVAKNLKDLDAATLDLLKADLINKNWSWLSQLPGMKLGKK